MMCNRPYVPHPTVKAGALVSKQKNYAVRKYGCGKCLPCRIFRARVWCHRIMLETVQHDHNSFLTLTYEHAPKELVPAHPKNFIKRLRKYIAPRKISYYLCGEYGTRGTRRPHYHAILFGIAPGEKALVDKAWSINGSIIGHTWLGDVTSASAGYVAGYITKGLDNEDDPWLEGRHPQFSRCSTKPAIGLRTIQDMAQKIRENRWYDNQPVTELRYGNGRRMPLGRYLFNKMGAELNWLVSDVEDLEEERINNYLIDAIQPDMNWYCMIKNKSRVSREKQKKKNLILHTRSKV